MGETSFREGVSLSIEHGGDVEPPTEIDAHEQVFVELTHSLGLSKQRDGSSAPVLALEAQLPTGCPSRKFTGTHVHPWRSRRGGRCGIAGEWLARRMGSSSGPVVLRS